MKNRLLLIFLSLIFITSGFAQKWTKVDNSSLRSVAEQRLVIPEKYESYSLDIDHFKEMLKDAPDRFKSAEKGIMIEWPLPGGKTQKFSIKRSDVFHSDLAAKYPEIKAFTGHSVSDPTAVLKISMSHKGIEGMLLSNRHETVYMDRYLPKSQKKYMLYKKSDYKRVLAKGEGTCTVEDPNDGYKGYDSSVRFGDCQLRKYRMALACTGEYANFHGGNIPDVLAEYNASMVRINGIYEREFTITMELIANTDELIFLNGNTDPYTNNDGGAMLSQNQNTIDNIIGLNNYDIGHVYSTGGGGIARLRSPCTNNRARGVTGLGNPTGDPFWVDYVAHEIGHQFGGNHTQNNSCQRNIATAVEPGSASTIMGYAGICSPNVQNNSDDYFHSVSQAEVANFVVAGNGGCAEIIQMDNTAPEINSATATGQVLPARTPFFLTVDATDADNDMLTYCWEQIDNEIATMPPSSTSSGGPAFRSFDPSESATRYFPGLASILFGINGSTWEVLTSVNRNMDFSITVRDNHPLGGCTADEEVSVTFTSSAGPFLITSQNTSTTWNAGDTETVTWDVANTDMAPVSCENIDIILSLDRGQNFDIIIAENVPNDGEHEIEVPFQFTTQGRIMVKCSDKTFFDINNRDLNIIAPFSSEVTPSALSLCPNSTATFALDYTVFGDDPYPVTFVLNGLPVGATYNFSPEETSEDTEVILTIENLTSDLVGNYDLEIVTDGATITQTETVQLTVESDQNDPISYLSPEDGQIGVATDAFLSWDESDGISTYEVEVSENPIFDDLVFNASTSDNFIFPTGLEAQTVYYWRVRGVSPCIAPIWQDIQSFQTRNTSCFSIIEEPNTFITLNGNNNIESEIDLTGEEGTSENIEVSLDIDHSFVGDLVVILRAPDATEVVLFDRPGVPNTNFGCDGNNIVATFTDSTPNTNTDLENTCDPGEISIEGFFQPQDPFSAFENTSLSGVWTLTVNDSFQGDGGFFTEWSIKNCKTIFLESGILLKNNVLMLNNTDHGMISNDLLEMENGDPTNTKFTMRSTPSFGEAQKMNSGTGMYEALGVGDIFSQEDINQDMIKYVLSDQDATEDSFKFDTQDDQSRYTSNNTFLISASISALTISANVTNQISCFGEADGRIEVMGMGGLSDYTYSINEGPFVAQNIFDNLSAGDYVVTVKDDAGTEVESQILTIVEPEEITFLFFPGDNEITVGAEGGTGSYMYSLDGTNFSSDPTLAISDGTMYRIYVRDENDCLVQSSNDFTFHQIGGATITSKDVDCKGNDNGSITIDGITGGLAPYMYQLNDEDPTTSNSFDNLPPDTYQIKISDASGGVDYVQMDIVIQEPDEELIISNEVVENTITLMGSGGIEPYQYSLDDVTYSDNNVFTNLEDGEYMGYIIDAYNCKVFQASIVVKTSIVDPLLDRLTLSPNPMTESFVLGSGTNIDFKYEIRDITGQLIYRGNTSTNVPISVQDIVPGLYIVKVTYRQSSKMFKISKIKG